MDMSVHYVVDIRVFSRPLVVWSRPVVRLHLFFMATLLYNDFEALWSDGRGLRSWLAEQTRATIEDRPGLRLVLVPSRAWIGYLQRRMAADGVSVGGIDFWTPSIALGWLTKQFEPDRKIADRATLHLLMTVAAEVAAVEKGGDVLTSRSVAADPVSLMGALDVLADAGVMQPMLGNSALERVAHRFNQLLEQYRFQRVQGFHREVDGKIGRAVGAAPLIEGLFICGFDAAHWPKWFMLHNLARVARTSVVAIPSSASSMEYEPEQLWLGNWEAVTGASDMLVSDDDIFANPCYQASLAMADGQPKPEPIAGGVEFVVGRTQSDVARLVVEKTVAALAETPEAHLVLCVPVGPSGAALARDVARELEHHKLPFHNCLPANTPGFFEQPAWSFFVDYLDNPTVSRLVCFLRSHSAPERVIGMPLAAAERVLDRVPTEILYDRLDVTIEHLRIHANEKSRALGERLTAIPALAERGTFGDYRTLVERMFKAMNWKIAADAIFHDQATTDHLKEAQITRKAFVQWLRESLRSETQKRGDHGSSPLSRITLATYADVDGLKFSHILALGQNETIFPGDFAIPEYLSSEAFDEVQQQFRDRNAKLRCEGPFGEGSIKLVEGQSLLLGPLERRWLASQDLSVLMENATSCTMLFSSATHTTQAEEMRPSEVFHRIYEGRHGERLKQEEFQAIALTRAGLALVTGAPPDNLTRKAFDIRRDPSRPFGAYDYGFDNVPPRVIDFTASDADRVLTTPAKLFMAKWVGVDSRDQTAMDLPWAAAVGNWTHQWVAAIGKKSEEYQGPFVPLPDAATIQSIIEQEAQQTRLYFQSLVTKINLPVPDWWQGAWEEARQQAFKLGQAVARAGRSYGWVATEVDLPPTTLYFGEKQLRVRGRTDMLLSTAQPQMVEGRMLFPANAEVLVIDHKTGSDLPLTSSLLVDKRKGVQPAIYGYGVAHLGATQVGMCILKPDGEVSAQITLENANEAKSVWEALCRMQETGTFGMLETVRPKHEFGARSPMPLAALPVKEHILEQKWQLTHGIEPTPRN
jgi:hypothetical protein